MTFTMLITINYFRVDAGGSPAATHFSCFAKKSKQKKATPGSSALRASLRYSERQAAAELGLVVMKTRKVSCRARPQTVLADISCRSCVARRLAWEPDQYSTTVAPDEVTLGHLIQGSSWGSNHFIEYWSYQIVS